MDSSPWEPAAISGFSMLLPAAPPLATLVSVLTAQGPRKTVVQLTVSSSHLHSSEVLQLHIQAHPKPGLPPRLSYPTSHKGSVAFLVAFLLNTCLLAPFHYYPSAQL